MTRWLFGGVFFRIGRARAAMPDSGRPTTQEPDVGEVAVSVADVLAAQARLRKYLSPTPLHYAERFGVWLKLENLQRTGSYKVRGALNALLAGLERGDERPVICASAGNHAQGVAWSAYRLGVQAITVMPHGAPQTKIAGVAHWGATVRQHGNSYDEAFAFARELADQNGYRFLSAFDDPDVIAGQGTVGIELAAHAPDVVIVPIGGGGLASGVALALKSQGVRIVGAQVEGVDSMARAVRGDLREITPVATLADGVKVKIPGFLTRRLCSSLLDDVVIVREAELRETLVRLALEEHVIAEGAGALALAAGRRVSGKRKCAVVSGGNIDATVLATLLSEVRPRPPRKPRRRNTERLRNERSTKASPPSIAIPRPSAVASTPVTAIAVEESSW
ncbi:threonine dehydratase [Xanthomonas arboricola]|nr:threonine dehydratase catabolic [Xanthomonas campestris pv. campestris str. 8004]AEL08518.1 threonine dehydratase catabolic [Xanthomonas campestris pv. raphani 756C]MCW1982423.1 threonine dehydratase [Xanthomonas campestris]MCW2002851.1 threonine dehydratase [Xanthomonas campestris]MCW2007758.1 threonine dehydratase [Xanthomonas campestris]